MPLKYANLCKICHVHRTQDPSGICSKCKRLKGRKTCIICGAVQTSNANGICYSCSTRGFGEDAGKLKLEDAIKETRLTLLILERRLEGNSFKAIAESCGLSRSGCYARYMAALKTRSISNTAIDAVDNNIIADED